MHQILMVVMTALSQTQHETSAPLYQKAAGTLFLAVMGTVTYTHASCLGLEE